MDTNHQPASDKPNYDFIMNPAKPPKKSILPGSGKTQRIIIATGGGALLLILIIVVFSLIFGQKDSTTLEMRNLVAEQQEIVRISELGAKNAIDSNVRIQAEITKMTVSTDQQNLLAQMKKNGIKVTPAELALKKNASTDQSLNSATTANRYDEVFSETINNELTSYRSNLKKTFNTTTGKSNKAVLATSFENVNVLLKQ